MLLFLAAFFLIYGGMHWYGYRKIMAAVAIEPRARRLIGLAMGVFAAAPVLVRIAERTGLNGIATVLAWLGYGWMGFFFLFVVVAGLLDLLWHGGRMVSRRAPRAAAGPFWLAWPVALLLCGYGWHEAHDLRLVRLVVPSSKLPAGAETLRIVQLSDVHLGLMVGPARLARILALVREARPDLLLVTGDLVDGQADGLAGLDARLREIPARFGKYAVTGNHEYYVGIDHSRAFMQAAGLTVLQGESVAVGEHWAVAGVDDPVGSTTGRTRPGQEERLASASERKRFTILLKHRPEVAPGAAGVFDLQLSGHVHGGQIAPFGLLTWFAYPVRTGLTRRQAGGGLLYVSRGAGTWGPPMRLLAPPEVTLIEVVPAGRPAGGRAD
ncbi:MAG TPA: metallophosphoesterase [Desulfurivibrionaceae bacterium]|nr:metallophosphoesterase [Desulfurivibrionaceae bacterium]